MHAAALTIPATEVIRIRNLDALVPLQDRLRARHHRRAMPPLPLRPPPRRLNRGSLTENLHRTGVRLWTDDVSTYRKFSIIIKSAVAIPRP